MWSLYRVTWAILIVHIIYNKSEFQAGHPLIPIVCLDSCAGSHSGQAFAGFCREFRGILSSRDFSYFSVERKLIFSLSVFLLIPQPYKLNPWRLGTNWGCRHHTWSVTSPFVQGAVAGLCSFFGTSFFLPEECILCCSGLIQRVCGRAAWLLD